MTGIVWRCLPRSPRNAQLSSEIVVKEGKSNHYQYQWMNWWCMIDYLIIQDDDNWSFLQYPLWWFAVWVNLIIIIDWFDIILFLLVNTIFLQYSKANPPIMRCWSWTRLWSAKFSSWVVWIIPQWPASRRLVICDFIEESKSCNLSFANIVKSFTEWWS